MDRDELSNILVSSLSTGGKCILEAELLSVDVCQEMGNFYLSRHWLWLGMSFEWKTHWKHCFYYTPRMKVVPLELLGLFLAVLMGSLNAQPPAMALAPIRASSDPTMHLLLPLFHHFITQATAILVSYRVLIVFCHLVQGKSIWFSTPTVNLKGIIQQSNLKSKSDKLNKNGISSANL